MIKNKHLLKGFTLFELIIAVAISSLVALGVFSMFSSIAHIRDKSVTQSQNVILVETLTRLINIDARMMTFNSFSLDESDEVTKLKFITQNSLRFNKAIPVNVSYYIDKDNWLIRREENTDMLFDMEMRLLPNADNLKVTFYDGSTYVETVKPNAKMINIELTLSDSHVVIPVARTMDNVQ